jgi:hypothetical protein
MQELKSVILRIEEQDHKVLKKIAFLRCISLSKLLRESVKESIKKHKKMLTKSDIMIS